MKPHSGRTQVKPSLRCLCTLSLCTFRGGLELLLDARAARAAVAGEGLHPEQVGRARGQITDLHRVLLQHVHDVGSHIQVVTLWDGGHGGTEVREEFSKELQLEMEAKHLHFARRPLIFILKRIFTYKLAQW